MKSNQKYSPHFIDDLKHWHLKRRNFIKSVGVFAIYSQILKFQSCQSEEKITYAANDYLTALEAEIIQKVQMVLFPNDGNGPSARDINAYGHFVWVLSDLRKKQAEKDYLINGIKWTEETAVENFSKSFKALSTAETEKLVEDISKTNWGEDWLAVVLSLIFEALVIDSLYNVNPNQIGWKWLEHQNGTPRPNEMITYDKIFETIGAE